MSIAQSLLPEFDHETANTRKVLERVPEAHAGWRPHAKSYTMGDLALHLANIPTWVPIIFKERGFDMGSGGGSRPQREFTTRAALLEEFDRNAAEAHAAIAAASDAHMMEPWTLKRGGEEVFTLPRVAALRSFAISHPIHHRGQLTVYLRLKDVPLPSIYGPSADEG